MEDEGTGIESQRIFFCSAIQVDIIDYLLKMRFRILSFIAVIGGVVDRVHVASHDPTCWNSVMGSPKLESWIGVGGDNLGKETGCLPIRQQVQV